MKVLVLSDSHGRADTMRRAIEAEKPHAMLYLGDGLSDAERMREEYPLLPITTVPGNCDWGSLDEAERLIELDGVRILMLHGHTRGVKYHSMNAYYAAREMGADVLLYGHTHCPLVDYDGTTYTMNPGSIRYTGTYGVLVLENGKVLDCGTRQLEVAEKK